VLAALCLGGPAFAQGAGVAYSSRPVGFYSNVTVGQSSNIFGSFAGFDGRDASAAFSRSRIDFPNGSFVGGGTWPSHFTLSGINRTSAFGGALYSEGMQFGYKFQNGLPLTVFAGFDTLKTNTGIGNPLAPFDSASGTLPGYRAHAGVHSHRRRMSACRSGSATRKGPASTASSIRSGCPALHHSASAAAANARRHPASRNDQSTSSGHGTMVDFTVFIAIASATARPIPSSENG
jgi:hypothetical protein